MASVDVNREFSEFGNKMNKIAILTIVNFVFGIIIWLISFVAIVILIISIVIFFIFVSALGNIKETGYALNNQNLHEFRSKIILNLIFGIIGGALFGIGLVGLFLVIEYGGRVGALIVFVTMIVMGIIFLIVAAIMRVIAWSNLEKFFAYNMELFPHDISNDAKNGANLCKIGAILDITIILGIIGDILRILGYFKLAALKRLIGAPPQPVAAPRPVVTPQPSPAPAGANFCPSCGTRVNPGINYCPECGSELS